MSLPALGARWAVLKIQMFTGHFGASLHMESLPHHERQWPRFAHLFAFVLRTDTWHTGFFLACCLGHGAAFISLCFAVLLLQSESNRFRLRLITIGLLAVLAIALAIVLLLQIPDVRAFFFERARLEQSYDSARLGRFARHWLGMVLATEHPLGIGPLEFGPMFGEDTHNVWLKAVLDYGWIGFIAFITLTFLTLAIGFKLMFRNRPWQPFLLCAYATYLGHVLIGNVIDTDHWRHFYLLFGLIWGCWIGI